MAKAKAFIHGAQYDIIDGFKIECRIDVLRDTAQDADLRRSLSELPSKIVLGLFGPHFGLLDDPCSADLVEGIHTIDICGSQLEDPRHSRSRSDGFDAHVHLIKDRALRLGMIILSIQDPLSARLYVV